MKEVRVGRLVKVTKKGEHNLKPGTVARVYSMHEILDERFVRLYRRHLRANVPQNCVQVV